jgi:enoyl-CoA hydratase/carnithine racemase
VRAIRLRGAGRAFCAGYDIGWGSESMQEAEAAPWDPIADYRTCAASSTPTWRCGARPSR